MPIVYGVYRRHFHETNLTKKSGLLDRNEYIGIYYINISSCDGAVVRMQDP